MFVSDLRRRTAASRPLRRSNRLYFVERLERRELLSAAGLASSAVAEPMARFAPAFSSGLSPYSQTPDMIRHAYGFDQISGDGAGQTIAIVDAYGDSKIASDLDTFDKTFGTKTYWGGQTPPADFTRSSSTFFSKLDQNGGHSYPANNGGWALETALDVEWVHAIAPGAKIVLVEAKSAGTSDLLAAVDTASKQPGVVAVSMSWGASEFSGETALDSHFTTKGITYVAASGDTGGQVIWPSASPNVLSVGGTTLTTYWPSGDTNKNGPFDYDYEIGWQNSGGGVSAYELQPAAQTQSDLVTQSSTQRVTPDISYDADPGSGVAVYSSVSDNWQTGWSEVGGTSAGAPQWAALAAVTDGLRKAAGLAPLGSLQADVYSLATSSNIQPTSKNAFAPYFNDVTYSYSPSGVSEPTPGYDAITGIGSPEANNLVPALAGLTEPVVAAAQASGMVTSPGASANVMADVQMAVATAADASPSSPIAPAANVAPIAPTAPTNPAVVDAALATYDYPLVEDAALDALAG